MPKSFHAGNISDTISFWSYCVRNKCNRHLFAFRISQEFFELQIDYLFILLSADFFEDYISLEGGRSRLRYLWRVLQCKIDFFNVLLIVKQPIWCYLPPFSVHNDPKVWGVLDVLNITERTSLLQTTLGSVLQCNIGLFNVLLTVKQPIWSFLLFIRFILSPKY